MRHLLIAVAVAAVAALSSTSATRTLPFGGGHTIVIAAPFDDPKSAAASPASGFGGGGTTVAITGTRFTSGAPVAFGASASASVTYNSPTLLTATAPAKSAGTDDIKVTTTSGTSATSSADRFTYPAPIADGLVVAVPFNNASFGKLNCFANANDVGNFYGTSLAEYQIAIGNGSGPGINGPTGFFSTTANGPPASDAQLCFVRIGASGGRARMVGAWICYVVGIGTPCGSARGAVTALPALHALKTPSIAPRHVGRSLGPKMASASVPRLEAWQKPWTWTRRR
jgi:hypothetical protein